MQLAPALAHLCARAGFDSTRGMCPLAACAQVRILTEPSGLAVPLSHITVSTSGEAQVRLLEIARDCSWLLLTPHHRLDTSCEAQNVYRLLRALPAVRVAFSLHAATEDLRSQLMPINRRVPLAGEIASDCF